MSNGTTLGLGWRVHSWWAVVVAVSGSAASPVVAHRERVTLLDDEARREPYHVATTVPLDEAPAVIAAVETAAEEATLNALLAFGSSLGPITAVGVVGGSRRLPADLGQRLASHALLHASERDLYERAVIRGAGRAGLPVTTVPAKGSLLADASGTLGVALAPSLASLGKDLGPPWQKDHKEATAAALLALHAAT